MQTVISAAVFGYREFETCIWRWMISSPKKEYFIASCSHMNTERRFLDHGISLITA